jgi:hypothetical protein
MPHHRALLQQGVARIRIDAFCQGEEPLRQVVVSNPTLGNFAKDVVAAWMALPEEALVPLLGRA